MMKTILGLAWLVLAAVPASAAAQSMQEVIGPGDVVRITAFRYPDLTTETRVSDEGHVSVPMIGQVELAGLTPSQAAASIAKRLKSGQYIVNPQIDVAVLEARSRQVSVLGFVTRPGRYMLDGKSAKLTDVLAMAGGLVPAAGDTAIVTRAKSGAKGKDKAQTSEPLTVDLAAIIRGNDEAKNIEVTSGDSVFIPKAPVVYVYGEVMRGGGYRLEPGMTVLQAISLAGGLTPRGSERRIVVRRRAPDGGWKEAAAKPRDPVAADDVIHVREGLF